MGGGQGGYSMYDVAPSRQAKAYGDGGTQVSHSHAHDNADRWVEW